MDENERGNDSCLDKDQVPCFCFSSLSLVMLERRANVPTLRRMVSQEQEKNQLYVCADRIGSCVV